MSGFPLREDDMGLPGGREVREEGMVLPRGGREGSEGRAQSGSQWVSGATSFPSVVVIRSESVLPRIRYS